MRAGPESALAAAPHRGALRILRVSRVVADLDRAEAFYRDGLGFRRVSAGASDPALPSLLGLPSAAAAEVVLRLGAEEVALVRFEPPGAPYPAGSRSDDAWFQHLAIVVDDMAAAYRRLQAQPFRAISAGGPERLPPRNGGVTAFKFRDPDGHPLELIHFPPGQGRPIWRRGGVRWSPGPFLGIDHSALAVGSTPRGLRFYRRLGFRVAAQSLNYGPAQARLDGLPSARVRVTGLRPRGDAGPGLELLGYAPPGRRAPPWAVNALVTDWVTVLVAGLPPGRALVRRDPDGHVMLLVGRPIRAQPGRRSGH